MILLKELGVDPTTISRDTAYLVSQSREYLNDLAKETLPFIYQTSIEGIRDVIKECWTIYQSDTISANMYQRLAALKVIKDCHEAVFHLVDGGPSIMRMNQLQERLVLIENRQTC
jgi:hypothetical protein